jgi:hypothetical protein
MPLEKVSVYFSVYQDWTEHDWQNMRVIMQVEITCRGRQLLPLQTLQHVRDSIWCQGEAVAPDMSAANHLMVLQYGRRP